MLENINICDDDVKTSSLNRAWWRFKHRLLLVKEKKKPRTVCLEQLKRLTVSDCVHTVTQAMFHFTWTHSAFHHMHNTSLSRRSWYCFTNLCTNEKAFIYARGKRFALLIQLERFIHVYYNQYYVSSSLVNGSCRRMRRCVTWGRGLV
jgi:hypothetical protein